MIKLGDEVRDKVSGFRGIITAQHTYLDGCNRFTVQPKVAKDGKLPKAETFDEPQLEIIQKEKVIKGSKDVGGPEKYMPTPRVEG